MPSLLTTAAFTLICVLISLAWVWAFAQLSRRLGVIACVVLGGWLALTATLAHLGLLHAAAPFPPPILRLLLAGALALVGLVLSPLGLRLANATPLHVLVGVQAFRLPLECVLWQLHRENALPVQMTFEGRNFDVLTGVLALPLAYALWRAPVARGWLWAWNLLGLGLLANIVQIAVRSMPGPLRAFHNEPANTLVFSEPWIWLPTLLVLTALAWHLLLARRLVHAG